MANGESASNEPRIVDKLRKILALTNNPNENEAQAAMGHLQRLLQEHNLSMADLEQRGAKGKPQIGQEGHDLGKAAFTWKLDLAEVMADHFFCYSIVNRTQKTVAFVGRPENVESMQMLYNWVMDQIKDIARVERRNHFIRTNEHIDPLRWQVNFGLGAVGRIRTRLREMREAQAANVGVTALVLSHRSEISDYLEEKFGTRIDGRKTKREIAWEAQWEAQKAADAALLESDPVAYYTKYPWRKPLTEAELAAQAKADEKAARKRANRPRSYSYRPQSEETIRRENQAYDARVSGRASADRVNLQPFIEGATDNKKVGG